MMFIAKILLMAVSVLSILMVLFTLPGTWLMVAASLVYSFFYDFSPAGSDRTVIFFLVAVALLGELLEFGVGILGSKTMQVSNKTIIASMVGGIAGALIGVPIPIVGSLLGLLAGTFLGAFFCEWIFKKEAATAFKSALAVFFSKMVAIFIKSTLAFGMVVYLFFKLFIRS